MTIFYIEFCHQYVNEYIVSILDYPGVLEWRFSFE